METKWRTGLSGDITDEESDARYRTAVAELIGYVEIVMESVDAVHVVEDEAVWLDHYEALQVLKVECEELLNELTQDRPN